MATFQEHIAQAKRNLAFISDTNLKNSTYWDWQVTACFYVAVHMVNAHLAQNADLHYRTHADVKNAINPYSVMSVYKVDDDIYLCYTKLEGLSRRARYLCHHDAQNRTNEGLFTYDKHFAKAVKYLDKIINFFEKKYSIGFSPSVVTCHYLRESDGLNYFKVINSKQNL